MRPEDRVPIYRLEEGKAYKFEIKRLVDISGSGDMHYVLIGPDDKKYLLKASYYDHYSLHPGMIIGGRVDKINCTGRIFIEPDNPYYSPGSTYEFQLISITEDKNIMAQTIYTARIKDIHNKEWECIIEKPRSFTPGKSILLCRVDRIKKARLFLSESGKHTNNKGLIKDRVYDFTITGIRQFRGEEHYIIRDEFGDHHTLEKKYYQHFAYKLQQSIKAIFVGYKPDGSFKLEPLNPFYKSGEVYMFRFISKETEIEGGYEGQDGGLCLEDHFNQRVKVKAKPWQLVKNYHFPEYIPCRVINFKKGRTVLENLSVIN